MSDYFNFNSHPLEDKSKKAKLKKFLLKLDRKLLASAIIIAVVVPLTVIISQKNQDTRSNADRNFNTPYLDYQGLLKEGSISPFKKIIEVKLSYENTNNDIKLKLISLEKKNGYVPQSGKAKKGYSLILRDAGSKVLYSLPFDIATKYNDPPVIEGQNDNHKRIELNSKEFALTIPYFSNSSEISIDDSEGKNLLTEPLTEIKDINNSPNFYTIKSGEIKKRIINNNINQEALIQPLGEERGGVGDQFLDVAFIGDKYTTSDLGLFHTNVNEFIAKMLEYEPFLSRSTLLRFNLVDNTIDLGCYHHADMTRLIICNDSLVIQEINNAATPYDQIVVIVKDEEYGGSGGGLSVSYNGYSGSLVFVHEFGHSFGKLLDEYVYSSTDDGPITNQVNQNCYAGMPPAREWENIIDLSDYYLGCIYKNWYRSTQESMMRSLGPPFNKVSQKILNSSLDLYAGISPTPIPSLTPIPTFSLSPSPTPSPTPSPSPTPVLQTLELSPSSDSYVRKDYPSTNFGTLNTLQTADGSSTISFLKFNLSPLSGKTIISAKFRIKVHTSSTSSQSLKRADNKTWFEKGITYNNKPSLTATITTFKTQANGKIIKLDVKNAVNLKKGSTLTLGITSQDKLTKYYSRESTSKPELVIEYR